MFHTPRRRYAATMLRFMPFAADISPLDAALLIVEQRRRHPE